MISKITTTSVFSRIASGIAIFGMAGFIGMILCGVWLSNITPSFVEMPLAELGLIGVDSSGQIYCVSDSYARLQVFRNDGRFLWGRGIGVMKGYRLWLDESDQVHILSEYQGWERVFDSYGKPLGEHTVSRTDLMRSRRFAADDISRNYALDKSGNSYTVVNPSIWPTIVKRSVSGQQTVVISPRIWLWPISGPFPAWFIMAIGGIYLKIQDAIRRQRGAS